MTASSKPFSAEEYLLNDYPRTLFPLNTTSILVEQFSPPLRDYLYKKLLPPGSTLPGFPVQQRCYAAKRGYNLRRTVKLDPAAEFFVYDIVFRNRKSFRPDHRPSRRSFGHRFVDGLPQSPTASYAEFKSAVASGRANETLTLKVDVATYFNSIYHHDLVNLVRSLGWANADVEALGRFLRELNAGRSVDCLPQGIHPCKVIGSEFLRFVDNSFKLRSKLGVRFLDDLHFFDADLTTLTSDLMTIQELLGEKGLSLNDSKTALGNVNDVDVPKRVDAIKRELLQFRRQTIEISGEEAEVDTIVQVPLDASHVDYLFALLASPDIEESDAELVLSLLRAHPNAVLPKINDLLIRYPGLTRNFYHFARVSFDRSRLDDVVAQFLHNSPNATEYQLFWLAKLAEDFLAGSPLFGDILMTAFHHPRATIVSRSKVLEIKDRRFGLPDLREILLRSGRSDWEAWSAAAGARAETPAGRNHLLTYFGKASPLNALIAECIRTLP
jgi:hypothetical protein